MTYFIHGEDNVGARLAFSSDTTGLKWQKYNNEQSILTPVRVAGANDNRMRDPMIAYDTINRRFNMVWTVSWDSKVIGWDTSSLLKEGTWGPQVGLPVSADIPNSMCSWAPEIFWDDIQSKWMLYWSVENSPGSLLMYYSLIEGDDFRTFSTPEILLDPGYSSIDGTIIKIGAGDYRMFFKDERAGYKYIRRISGTTPQTFDINTISGPLTAEGGERPNRAEGPTIVKQGGEYHLFIDHYTLLGVKVIKMKNIDTTHYPMPEENVYYGNNNSNILNVSHCNIIEVPKMLVKWMLHNDSSWVKYVKGEIVKAKDIQPAPAHPLQRHEGAATMVDLLGKSVKVTPPINRENRGAPDSRLPAGYRVVRKGKETEAGVNIESSSPR